MSSFFDILLKQYAETEDRFNEIANMPGEREAYVATGDAIIANPKGYEYAVYYPDRRPFPMGPYSEGEVITRDDRSPLQRITSKLEGLSAMNAYSAPSLTWPTERDKYLAGDGDMTDYLRQRRADYLKTQEAEIVKILLRSLLGTR